MLLLPLISLTESITYSHKCHRLSGIRAYDIADFFTVRPWNAITWFPVGIYPVCRRIGVFHAVGVVVLLLVLLPLLASTPRDRQLQSVYQHRFRMRQNNLLEHISVSVYLQCGVRADTWGKCSEGSLGANATLTDQDEPISYRAAVIWMLLSITFLIGFCYKMGMSLWVIATFFGLFFGLATGITRMRAELGSPVHDQHYAGPDRMMYSVLGAKSVSVQVILTGMAYLYFFNRAYDCLLMPHHLEGLKIAERCQHRKQDIREGGNHRYRCQYPRHNLGISTCLISGRRLYGLGRQGNLQSAW